MDTGRSPRAPRVLAAPSPGGTPLPAEIEAHRDRSDRNGGHVARSFIGDVETTFHGIHRDLPMRRRGFYSLRIDLFGPLYTHSNVDQHRTWVDIESSQQNQRAVMNSVLDGTHGGLRIISSVPIIPCAHFQKDALRCHAPLLSNPVCLRASYRLS